MRSGIFAALLWPALATAAGHPDLSGNWEGVTGSTSAVSYPTAAAPGGSINAGMMSPELAAVALKQMQETGAGKAASALRGMQSQPQFRTPELARRAEELWQNGSGSDAVVACGQPGLPRIGAPLKIVQTARELVFLYADVAGMAWRIVPTDGRGFRERLDPSYYGDSVGHWEGDTLVVDTTNFRRETHYRNSGERLHVVERFTRTAPDTLRYRVTVEDPDTWAVPWTAEIPFKATTKQIFEYACHEGSRTIEYFMRGARDEERRGVKPVR